MPARTAVCTASYHGEQIAEFVEVESGESSDRSSLPPMALAKRRKAIR